MSLAVSGERGNDWSTSCQHHPQGAVRGCMQGVLCIWVQVKKSGLGSQNGCLGEMGRSGLGGMTSGEEKGPKSDFVPLGKIPFMSSGHTC